LFAELEETININARKFKVEVVTYHATCLSYIEMRLCHGSSLSPQRPRPVHVGFVVDEVALGQVFLRFSPFSITPPWLSMLIYHLGDEQ
jgi:hypothetical protein